MKKDLLNITNSYLLLLIFLKLSDKFSSSMPYDFLFNQIIFFIIGLIGLILTLFLIKFNKDNTKIFENKIKWKNIFTVLVFTFSYSIIIQYLTFDNKPKYFFNIQTNISFLILLFSTIILYPIFEEFFFRFLILNYFIKKRKFILGIIANSLMFSLAHFILNKGYFDYIDFIVFSFMGITFSLIKIHYGLLFSIISHSILNIIGVLYNQEIINLYMLDYINNKIYTSILFVVCIIFYIGFLIYSYNYFKRKI